MGFRIVATRGTATFLKEAGVQAETAWRIAENRSPDALDLMRRRKIDIIINTPTEGSGPVRDGHNMRRLAVELEIPFITTLPGAKAIVQAIEALRENQFKSLPLGEYWSEDHTRSSDKTDSDQIHSQIET